MPLQTSREHHRSIFVRLLLILIALLAYGYLVTMSEGIYDVIHRILPMLEYHLEEVVDS
jgi:hypothetical protein